MLAMLEAYFDDSGTHGGSPAVAWGGVAGDRTFLDQLDRRWRAQLLEPCEGKPPVNAFHSYDLDWGEGEFGGYSRAERDLTRANFRRIIVECGVTVLAYGISVKDWQQVVNLLGRKDGSAEEFIFGRAIFGVVEAAKLHGDAISINFDQGRNNPKLQRMIAPAVDAAKFDGRYFSYGFLPVSHVPALQAADLVVHEAFRVFRDFRKDGRAVEINPHTKRLIADSFDANFYWMGRSQIKRALERLGRAKRKKARVSLLR